MNWFTAFFTSSLGKKVIMSITGLFLCVFLLTHLAGNLLLFAGPEAFNEYAEFMSTSIYIRGMEIVLAAGFLFHIIDAIILTKQNKAARGSVGYKKKHPEANSTWFSRNMGLTGFIILLFLILHLYSFVIKERFEFSPVGSMYCAVEAALAQWWYSLIYITAFVLLAFHLVHGFQSAFRSLGWVHMKYTPFLVGFSRFFAVAIFLGYTAIAVYFWLFHEKIC